MSAYIIINTVCIVDSGEAISPPREILQPVRKSRQTGQYRSGICDMPTAAGQAAGAAAVTLLRVPGRSDHSTQ